MQPDILTRQLQEVSEIHKNLLRDFFPLPLQALDSCFLVNTLFFFFFFKVLVNFQASGLILSVNSVIYGVKKSNVHLQLAAGCEVGWLGPPGHPRWLAVLGGLLRAAAGGELQRVPVLVTSP